MEKTIQALRGIESYVRKCREEKTIIDPDIILSACTSAMANTYETISHAQIGNAEVEFVEEVSIELSDGVRGTAAICELTHPSLQPHQRCSACLLLGEEVNSDRAS